MPLHAFAIALGLPQLSAQRLADAVAAVGRQFGLDPATAWQAASPGGGVAAAGVHHGAAAAPRRYVWREGEAVTLLDGLPVDPRGAHRGHDARELATGWGGWTSDLEGQFCAARLDLAGERAEVQLDTFGLVPVYVGRSGGGLLASNTVQAIRTLLGASDPDPLGVSTMVGLGWAVRRHTLLREVRALAGGGVHVLTPDGGVASRVRFGPAQLAAARRRGGARVGAAGGGVGAAREVMGAAGEGANAASGRVNAAGAGVSAEELAERMGALVASAVADVTPVRCALTAGRDSRLLLAFLRAGGRSADYYTIGWPGEADVEWGQALAARYGLPYHVVDPAGYDGAAGDAAAAALVAQGDGLSSLGQLADQLELGDAPPAHLGVKLWGTGSEIGRAGPGDAPITIANVPLLGYSRAVVTRALAGKAGPYRELMTAAAQAELERSIRRFADERRAEGWRTWEVPELFFTFERVGCHGATAPRRAARADDLFSPYCSRVYATYCLALSSAQRYVELPYHQLLARVDPELYRHPFEQPLHPPQAWRAGPRAVGHLAAVAWARARAGQSGWKHLGYARPPVAHEWLEHSLPQLRELFAVADSPLWELIDRRRAQALLAATPQERHGHHEGLLRAATVVWYFHGPAPAGGDAGG